MIRLFDIVGTKPVASEHTYTLAFLSQIRDEFPMDHDKIYAYLFYMSCPNPEYNPFFDVPESDKDEFVRREVGGSFDTDEPSIQYALEMCNKMYETPTARAFKGIKIMIDKMGKSLEQEEITYGRDGNAMSLLRIAEKFDAIRQSFKGVYKDLMEEQQTTVRGGKNIAYDG